MKTTLTLLFSGLLLNGSLLAQDRASMEAPVIKSDPESVTVMVRISDFTANESYRLGLGVAEGDLSKAKIGLQRDGQPLNLEVVEFKQGFTSSWWSVAELSVWGFYLDGPNLPAAGQSVAMSVEIPRSDAEKAGKFYVFVAKKYGGSVWYLEDGTELSGQDW
jgi:hypothetical protein